MNVTPRPLNDMEATIYRQACQIARDTGRDLPTPGDTGRILDLSYQAGRRWRASWDSYSGTDRAEGEVFRCLELCYLAIAGGAEIEAAIADQDARWRQYAAENNAKVEAAPKIRRGGSAGLSVISHRWVSPEEFATRARHLRGMVQEIQS